MFRNVRDLLLLRLVSSSWFERRQCIEHNIVKLLTQLRNYTTQSHYSQTYVSFVRHYKRPSILINCIGIPYLSLTGQATYFSGCRLFIHISAPYHVPTVFFYSVSVKYEPISITIGKHVLQKTLNKTVHEMPTSPKMCASTTLDSWSDRLSRHRRTYMYISMTHWIATKHDWQLLSEKSTNV